jgi:hypothetical protein
VGNRSSFCAAVLLRHRLNFMTQRCWLNRPLVGLGPDFVEVSCEFVELAATTEPGRLPRISSGSLMSPRCVPTGQ